MNPTELFLNQPALIQVAQDRIKTLLEKRFRLPIEAGSPDQRTSPTPILVKNLGMVRLLLKDGTGATPLGFASPQSDKIFYELVATKSTDVLAADPKVAEAGIMQALADVICEHLKEKNPDLDTSQTMVMTAAKLGFWAKIPTTQTIRFPFMIGDHQIMFEMPVFDTKFHQEFTLRNLGIKDSTKIFIVDDSATTRKLSRYHLTSMGYWNCVEYTDGIDAIAALQAAPLKEGLIIADWHMPKVTGIELLKQIRASEQLKHLIVILVTGERNKEEIAKALANKVSGYVMKPFEAETLFKTIKAAASRINPQ